MTVVRENAEIFFAPEKDVVLAVKRTLTEKVSGYRYSNVCESSPPIEFSAVIKPPLWPLILSTPLSIRLFPHESSTKVVVRTTSQSFIVGDVFNSYGRYIETILGAIRSHLETRA